MDPAKLPTPARSLYREYRRAERVRRFRRKRTRSFALKIAGLWTLAALASTFGCTYCGFCCNGPKESASNQAWELAKSVELYKIQQGILPRSLDDLANPPTGKSIVEKVPKDPWGNRYHLLIPGLRNPHKFDVHSSGPDGIPFTEDDVGNWPEWSP